jgi:hypothetical protein
MALTGNKYTGDNMYLSWGGTEVEAELLREVAITANRDVYEKTGAGERGKRKHGGKYEYQIRITLWASDEDADAIDIFDETATAVDAVIFGPNGNTSGEPRRTCNAWVTSVEEGVPHDGMVAHVVTADVDGDLTKDTFA